MSKDRKIVNNYREMIENTEKLYSDNIAYVYKKDYTAKEPEYIEKTFAQTIKDIRAFSTTLLNMGLRGKKVVLIGKNRYEWCVSYLAVTSGDMVIVPLDKALPNNEIETLVRRSEAEVVIFDEKYMDVMTNIRQKSDNSVKFLICMDDVDVEQVQKFSDLVKKGQKLRDEGNKQYDEIEIDKDKMSIMLFTSGTTNAPKAVMLSQQNICANVCNLPNHFDMLSTDTMLSFLPIHHTFECTITFIYGFYSGAKVAFCDGLKYIQKNLKEYKVNIFVAVPLVLETMYKKILKAINDQGKTKLIGTATKISNTLLKLHIDVRKKLFKQVLDNFGGNLRIILYGGAPMSKETTEGLNNFGIKTIQGYGLTETSPVITAESEERAKPGSIGFPLDNLEVKIDDPNEEGVGEILAKGPSIMLGYYKNEEETNRVLQDGWFRTGDFGYFDKDGFLYITGRKKDIIVLKNGKNVYPQEIEFLINKIPYVSEVMVYAREQDTTDTLLCAKIVYDETIVKEMFGEKTEEEYKKAIWEDVKKINQSLPIFKHIKKITITTEPLIKTTTQKVKRHEEMKKIQ
ncbi:MAG: AMP-binding protein [Clostridia bacterium]|nr:AMP-binding protein [Clostridia bacterium]